jgi:choice-of-anchor C domain-containing protein
MRRFTFFLALFLFVPCFAFAQISNPSFEIGTDPAPFHITVFAPDTTTITSWFVSTGTIDYVDGSWQAAEGVRSVDTCGQGPGTIQQDIALTVGHTYILTFALAGNPEGPPTVKDLRVTATGNPFQDYQFDLTSCPGGCNFTNMGWVDETYTFTATAATTTLAFEGRTQTAYGAAIDYLRITDTTIPPTLSKAFGAADIRVNESTSLSFTVDNPNTISTLTGIGFSDTLPSGLVVSTPNGLTGSCGGGSITATAGTDLVILSGATLAANSSCTFSVNVTAIAAGLMTNTTSTVSTAEGIIGSPATASISVSSAAAVPTLTGWGIILLMFLLGFSYVYFLKRQRRSIE